MYRTHTVLQGEEGVTCGVEGGEAEGKEGVEVVPEEGEEEEEAVGEEEEGVEAAMTVYVQSGETATGPFADAPATLTVTVPLAGTVYVFEAVLS